jgi:CHASE3 domain sensor protein
MQEQDSIQTQKVIELLKDGKENDAVNLIRESTQCGVIEARDKVDRLLAKIESGELDNPVSENEDSKEYQPQESIKRKSMARKISYAIAALIMFVITIWLLSILVSYFSNNI